MTLRDTRGNTPLHLAAMNNHLDAALYMVCVIKEIRGTRQSKIISI